MPAYSDFVKEDLLSKKPFLRTWLYEMKSIRNAWAHWVPENIDYRLGNRAYDTLSLLFLGFNGNPQSELFEKIEFYRKKLLIATAKNYHLAGQGN